MPFVPRSRALAARPEVWIQLALLVPGLAVAAPVRRPGPPVPLPAALPLPASAPASIPAPASAPIVPPPASLPAMPKLPTQTYTLGQAERYALAHSPLLGVTAAATRQAQADVAVARAAELPSVYNYDEYLFATGNNSPTAYLSVPDLARVGTDNPGTPPPDRWHSGYSNGLLAVTGELLLFDFGSAEANVRAARQHAGAAALQQREVSLAVLASTDEAYLSVLAAHKAVVAGQEAVARANQDVAYAQAGLKAGLRSEIDVARASDELAMAELAVARANGQVEGAQVTLAAVLGAPAMPLPDATAIPPPTLPAGGESDLIGQALTSRPDLQALGLDVQAAASFVESLRRERLPSLTAVGGISGRGQAVTQPYVNWDVGAVLSVPLYDPLLAGRIDRAKADQAMAEARRLALGETVAQQVVAAMAALRASEAEVAAARTHEAAATATLALARGRYAHGFGTWPELTDAEAQKIDADLRLIQARYDEERAAVDLRSALGNPPPGITL